MAGNGGSAATGAHLVEDLQKLNLGKHPQSKKMSRVKVINLTDNIPLLTAWANDEGWGFSLGKGTMTVSFEPIALDGRLTATRLVLGLSNSGGGFELPEPVPGPLPTIEPGTGGGTGGGAPGNSGGGTGTGGQPEPTPPPPGDEPPPKEIRQDVPTIELFDRTTASWVAFEQIGYGESREIADPGHYVDPASGAFLVRFGNPDPDNTGAQYYFSFGVRLEGVIE